MFKINNKAIFYIKRCKYDIGASIQEKTETDYNQLCLRFIAGN